MAFLVHDPDLDPALVGAVAAAVCLALATERAAFAAADAERQRMQRDLHDGVQQKLLAVSMLVRHANVRVADPSLASAAEYLPEVVEELRGLAAGLHPPILVERGLAAAVEGLAERSLLPLTVDIPAGRWPPDVERAAYFVIAEALSNVYKHARAGGVDLCVRCLDGRLVVEVSDDGIGGADAAGGTGLRGLHDRVGALGGRLRVSSVAGTGTRVTAELPCGS